MKSMETTMPFPIEILLFGFLIAVGIAVVLLEDLFAAAMLTGMFSLLSASLFTLMDAVDVAFTEAAVGAGISTVLVLGTLALTHNREKSPQPQPLPILIVLVTGAALIYGTLDMPAWGDPSAPIHAGEHSISRQIIAIEAEAYSAQHAAADPLKTGDGLASADPGEDHSGSDHDTSGGHGPKAVGLPNIVTSILASYRGYDTLGETGVIFTAGVGVMLLLGSTRRREEDPLVEESPMAQEAEE
jgi:multicomponent Na+:H+ antiporter subunit B